MFQDETEKRQMTRMTRGGCSGVAIGMSCGRPSPRKVSLRDPLYISGMDKVRNFKFGVRIELQAYKAKNAKVGQKVRGLRHVTYFFKFWDPLHISGMGAARDFKFGVRIHRLAYKPKSANVGQKGRGLRHVTYFFSVKQTGQESGMNCENFHILIVSAVKNLQMMSAHWFRFWGLRWSSFLDPLPGFDPEPTGEAPQTHWIVGGRKYRSMLSAWRSIAIYDDSPLGGFNPFTADPVKALHFAIVV